LSHSEFVPTSPSAILTQIAGLISDILCPPALAIPALLIGVWFSGVTETYSYALLYFAAAVPLPVGYFLWLLKTGRITDFHLPNRRDRRGPFAVASIASLGGIILLGYLGAPVPFLALLIAVMAEMLVLFLITLAWQISIHTATAAGLATFAAFTVGSAAIALALLVPAVMWARIYLRRHTLAQTVAGCGLGCAIFGMLFSVHGLLW
jgi:membrane-associated phospholipid phosphatase